METGNAQDPAGSRSAESGTHPPANTGTARVTLWLAALALTGFASAPLFLYGWWSTHDGLTYPARLAEFSYLLAAGEFYPRWAPSFHWGFGYPVFLLLPPLWSYLGALFQAAGLDTVNAVKAVAILSWLLAFGFSCGS